MHSERNTTERFNLQLHQRAPTSYIGGSLYCGICVLTNDYSWWSSQGLVYMPTRGIEETEYELEVTETPKFERVDKYTRDWLQAMCSSISFTPLLLQVPPCKEKMRCQMRCNNHTLRTTYNIKDVVAPVVIEWVECAKSGEDQRRTVWRPLRERHLIFHPDIPRYLRATSRGSFRFGTRSKDISTHLQVHVSVRANQETFVFKSPF